MIKGMVMPIWAFMQMMMLIFSATEAACEGECVKAEHVESRHHSASYATPIK